MVKINAVHRSFQILLDMTSAFTDENISMIMLIFSICH
jgi:hypothetical protein